MNLKVMMTNFGFNHAQIEIEENCKIEELGIRVDKINHELEQAQPIVDLWTALEEVRRRDPYPASPQEIQSLCQIAKMQGTDFETVCRGFGFDPRHLCSRDCREMIKELTLQIAHNKKPQPPADFVGFQQTRKNQMFTAEE